MESAPQGSQAETSKPRAAKNAFGWTLFAVTIAIILYQLYIHGSELITVYGREWLGGTLIPYFRDAQYNALGKWVIALWIFNDLFMSVFLVIALVFLLLRKKAATALLIVFISCSVILDAVVALLLQNLLPVSVSQITWQYNLMAAAFLAADILLFFLYLKSKQFRAICRK